jgi:putative proteasome-type protease
VSYGVGILLDEGLVMAADSRTNAGVDRVATFRKLYVFEQPGERLFVVLTAGNLSITQSAVSHIAEAIEGKNDLPNLMEATSMYKAARIVGRALRTVHEEDGAALKSLGIEFNASIILGGQVKGGNLRLFEIYAAGNFIEATDDTPYFQIGEVKYGKPVIDRVVTKRTGLLDAVKCALVSFDSTMRSNISVGPPIDLVVARRDAQKVALHLRLEENDPYFQRLRRYWGRGLQRTFKGAPAPEWEV